MKNLEWRWLWMLTAQSYGCFHFDPSIRQGKTQLLPLRFISEYCLPSPLYSSLHSLPSDARVVQMTTLYSFDLAQDYLSPTECVALAIKQTSTAITHNSPIGFRHGCTTTVLFLPCWHNKMCFREEDGRHVWCERWYESFLLSVLCVKYFHETLVIWLWMLLEILKSITLALQEKGKGLAFKAFPFTRAFLQT